MYIISQFAFIFTKINYIYEFPFFLKKTRKPTIFKYYFFLIPRENIKNLKQIFIL